MWSMNLNITLKTIRDILSLLGHCIAMLYAMARYLVKLTELETSWGVAIK